MKNYYQFNDMPSNLSINTTTYWINTWKVLSFLLDSNPRETDFLNVYSRGNIIFTWVELYLSVTTCNYIFILGKPFKTKSFQHNVNYYIIVIYYPCIPTKYFHTYVPM